MAGIRAVGLAAAGVLGVGLAIGASMGGGEGEALNGYSERTAAAADAAAAGIKFDTKSWQMDRLPASKSAAGFAARLMMRAGGEATELKAEDITAQGRAAAACALAAANAIPFTPDMSQEWVVARGTDRLDGDENDAAADGHFIKAGDLCIAAVNGAIEAGSLKELQIPVALAED